MSDTKPKTKKPGTARRVGPKRSEASRLAVQNAALTELTRSGWRNFSVDRVAKEAKASKQTIYRWWPTPACLVVEAAIEKLPKPQDPNTELKARIVSILSPLIDSIKAGNGAHMWRGVLLAASDDEQAGEIFRNWLTETYKKPIRFILAELTNKNQIRRDWNIELVIESLLGPIWHRIVAMRAPVPENYLDALADALVQNLKKQN